MFMKIKKPPMGWNTWNTFGPNICEELILEVADILIEKGFKDAGYEYVILDDGWQCKERKDGKLIADSKKFPRGIEYLSNEIHKKGLKLGIYSACGTVTCAGFPSSLEHEWQDAETFAEMGIDYLKYDYCFRPRHRNGEQLYRTMGLALDYCNREILFAACSWGADETVKWIGSTGANTWRSTPDITDNWQSIKDIASKQRAIVGCGGRGCYNDMDMLVVGMKGAGHVGLEGCTETEYKTHFAFWCMMQSPLIIGCDIRNIENVYVDLLKNKYLLRINQDQSGKQCFILDNNWDENKETYTVVRYLEDGEIAIGLFNFADKPMECACSAADLGLNISSNKELQVIDCFSGEKVSANNGLLLTHMPAHDCQVYIARVVNKS